jgi:5-methylcytosine-specific restriction endonuclease McrA
MRKSRDYKHEYQLQKKRGETEDQLERQRARRLFDKEGVDRKGMHIDHIVPIKRGGKSTKDNLRLRDPKENVRHK